MPEAPILMFMFRQSLLLESQNKGSWELFFYWKRQTIFTEPFGGSAKQRLQFTLLTRGAKQSLLYSQFLTFSNQTSPTRIMHTFSSLL